MRISIVSIAFLISVFCGNTYAKKFYLEEINQESLGCSKPDDFEASLTISNDNFEYKSKSANTSYPVVSGSVEKFPNNCWILTPERLGIRGCGTYNAHKRVLRFVDPDYCEQSVTWRECPEDFGGVDACE